MMKGNLPPADTSWNADDMIIPNQFMIYCSYLLASRRTAFCSRMR